ncbi:hypothetical protein [Algoriphagus halophilus]|uniref:Sulfotransferase family protein n=1 Tax=Algoriphagus halophilus TaxID=226505 RepID=A0A1N6E9H8_9BACT|nr:hypothetical protein [Algoriphagus halophilus]SIN79611.1 hypothetical protein SAMN05444394_1865 [Algoriphagus halophilus]
MKKKLIFIGGASRSGTTLIGNVFSNCANAVFLGELFRFFIYRNNDDSRKVPSEHTSCGCGVPVYKCPYNVYNNLIHDFPYNPNLYSKVRMSNFFYKLNKNDLDYIRNYNYYIFNKFKDSTFFVDSSKMGKLYKILKLFHSESYFIWVYRPYKEVVDSWSKEKSYLGSKSYFSSAKLFAIEVFWSFLAYYTTKSKNRLFLNFNNFRKDPNFYISQFNKMTDMSIPYFEDRHMKIINLNHSMAGNPSKGDQVYDIYLK